MLTPGDTVNEGAQADAEPSHGSALARARAVITRPLRRLNRRLRPGGLPRGGAWRRRRVKRDQLQAQFNRYSRAYFQRWLFLGAVIGLASGLLMATFFHAIALCTHLLLGVAGFTPPEAAGEGATIFAAPTRPWLLPVITGLGGLIVGLLVYNVAPETARGGTDNVLTAFHEHNGMLRKRVAPIKLIASAITIGSGGSAGREGAAAQIMAGAGSWLAQTLHLDDHDRRIAVVAGMSAGIGTIFRAPFAGAIFGAEVLYKRDFEADAIFPSFIASVVGYTVYGVIEGWQPIFGPRTDFGFHDPRSLLGFLALGVIAGVIGLFFEATMATVTRTFDRIRAPRWLKPAIGGALVGLIGMYLPASLGMGYGFVQFSVNNDYTTLSGLMLALLVFAKIATTSLTIGSGGSGGDVAPAMVAGGFLGGALWAGLHFTMPWVVAGTQPGAFVLVGMAAFFGGISKTPLAMILLVTEMSGELSLIAPAMVATMVAYVVTGDASVYRGQVPTRLDSPAHRDDYAMPLMQRVSVRETLDAVGGAPPPVVASDASLAHVSALLRESGASAALAREDGRIVGILTLSDLARTAPNELDTVRVGQVVSRAIVSVYPDETLYAAWLRMTRRGMRQMVVVERGKPNRRLGLLSLDDVRQVLRLQRISARPATHAEQEAATATARPAATQLDARRSESNDDIFASLRVDDVMQRTPPTVGESTPLADLRPIVYREGSVLVVDAAGALTGIITLRDLRERGSGEDETPLLAREIATRNLVTARRRERLRVAIRRMVRAGLRQLPILDSEQPGVPVGLLRREDALKAFDRFAPTEEPSGESPTSPRSSVVDRGAQ